MENLDVSKQSVSNDTKISRFNSDGLSKVREQIEKQRKLATKDESVNRVRHYENDPVNFVPSSEVYKPKETTVLTSKQPKVRKVATVPPPSTYKGFNEAETKIVTPDGKMYKEGEMKRKVRTRKPSKNERKNEGRALQPHKTSMSNKTSVPVTGDEKRKVTRKIQRVSAPKDRKPHRIDHQGIITARSWREGQKVAMKVLGPPPKKKIHEPVKEHKPLKNNDDDDDEVIMQIEPSMDQHQMKGSDDEELSQHTIESTDKPTNTAALSEQAKEVLGDLHLDKSDDSDDEHDDNRGTSGSKLISKTSMKSKKKVGVPSKRKLGKYSAEPQLPAQKVRHYDSDDVRKFMMKQQADRKKKQQEMKKQQQIQEDKKNKQLEELYKKQKHSVKVADRKKNVSRRLLDETFSKYPNEMPMHHPFPQERKRVELSGSDKENKGLNSTSSSSTYSDDSLVPSTPADRSPRESKPLNTEVRSSPKPTMNQYHHDGSPFQPRSEVKGQPGARTTSIDNLTGIGKAEFDFLDMKRRPYSSSMTDLRYRSNYTPGFGASHSAGQRSKADRLAAIKDMASALQGRIEAEARRLAGDLDTSANRSKLDVSGSERWAYPTDAVHTSPPTTRYERISGAPIDYSVFSTDLPGIGSLSDHARQASDVKQQDKAATMIQAAYRGHHVRQGLMWKLPSGHTLGDHIHRTERTSPMISPHHSDSSLSDNYGETRPKFKELMRSAEHRSIDRSQRVKDSESPYRELLSNACNRRDYYNHHWDQPKADGFSVIDIFTRRYEEAGKDQPRKVSKDYYSSKPHEQSVNQSYSYEDDFTGASMSRSHAYQRSPSPADKTQRSLSKAVTYTDDFTASSSNASKRTPSDQSSKKSSEKRTPKSFNREDTLEEATYSHSFSSSEEDTLRASVKRSRTPSPRTTSGKSGVRSPVATGNKSPVSDRRSPVSERKSPVSDRKSPVNSRSPVTRDYVNGFHPVEEVPEENDIPLSRQQRRSDVLYRPVPHGRPVTDGPPRMSPSALELKMAAELNLLESMEESMRQLTEVERTRAVSLAQQESVSLAQILKARQQSHERELQLLSMKARQEADAATRQLEEARSRAAASAVQAEKTLVQVRKEAQDAKLDTAHKLMQSQAEAAKVTAEAAKQLAEARHASLEQVAAMQKFDPTKVASETASAAAAAAVTAALERQRQQQVETWKEARAKKAKQLSEYSMTASSSPSSRADSRTMYLSDFTDYSSTTTKSKQPNSPPHPSYSVSDGYRSEKSPVKDKEKKDKDVISTASSLQTAVDSAKSNSSIKTASDVSIDRDNSQIRTDDSSIHTDVSVAKDSSKSESIAEEITSGKVSGEDYSMQFDSHTEDEIDEKSFRMLLPSESHRRRSSRGNSDHASSSDETTLTHDASKSPQWGMDDMSCSPFSAEESFNKFTAEMVRQYMREEELRAQHQAALLRLREKALKEKTKAEMAWLEHQKRRMKDKGTDEAMPPIRKKQRGLLMKLKQEQAEIERLKAANKAASEERKLLLYQQQEISRIKRSAQAYWERVNGKPSADDVKSDDDISLGLDDSISDIPEILSDGSSPSPTKMDRTKDDSQLSASEKQAKVMQKLKKMKNQSNEKFLTRREQQLMKRRLKAEELLKWKKKLDEEELKVQSMEKEALRLLEEKAKASKASKESKGTDGKQKEAEDKTKKEKDKLLLMKDVKDDSSITEDISQASSIPEDIPTESATDKNSFHVPTGNGFSSDDTITEDYANEKFESADNTTTVTSRGLTPRSRTPRSISIRSPLSPVRGRRDEESGSEESFSLTQSETTSDLSDVEGRITALKDELKRRKTEVERLRKQQKKRHREKLRAQEASLKKQLEAYEKYIEKTKADLVKEKSTDKVTVKPQIKQPKAAESRRIKDQTSPRQQKTLSELDTSKLQTSTPEKKDLDTSKTSSRSSADDQSESYASTTIQTEDSRTADPSPRRRTATPRSYKEDSVDSISIRLGEEGPEVITPRPPPPRSQSPDSRPTSRLSDITDASDIPEDIPLSARSAKSLSEYTTPRLPDIQEKSDVSSGEIKSQSDIPEEIPSQVQDSAITEDVSKSETPSPRILLKSDKEVSAKASPEMIRLPEKIVTDSGSQEQEDLTRSFDKSEHSESEKSKSYTYSEDFTSPSPASPGSKSGTDDEISELSMQSYKSSSEKSEELVIDLKAGLERYEAEMKPAFEGRASPDGSVTPVDDDKTPVASPSETPTPKDDELIHLNVGDRVLVGGVKPGTLRFKGYTSFADGIWGGIELDSPNGTNDGSYAGKIYFICDPGYGIFAPPDKLSAMPDGYRYEETESDIESIEEEMKSRSPQRLSQEMDIFDEEINRYETSESSKQTVKSGTVDAGKKEISDGDSTLGESELERIISQSTEFTKSSQSSVNETSLSQSQKDKMHGRTMEDVVDSITDQLTVAVVKDTLIHVSSVSEKKLSPQEKQTPLLDMLLGEQEQVDSKDTETKGDDKLVDIFTKTLLTEAVAQMQNIKRQRDQKIATAGEEDGRITPISEIDPPSLVSGASSPEKEQYDSLSPVSRMETPYTPSPVDNKRDDDDEPLSDEVFADRIRVENNQDDTSFPEPVARPSSPIPGETGDSQWKMLEEDFADVLGDGEWFDDDFGSMPRGNSIVNVPQRTHPDGEDSAGVSQKISSGERSTGVKKVELQRLTEELFYAVPHNKKEVSGLTSEAAKVFFNQYKSGEQISDIAVPDSFLGSDTKGSDVESVSKKAYKLMVFDLTREVFRDIYSDDTPVYRPAWMKPKRVTKKYYHNPQPPDSISELTAVVEEQVNYLLSLQKRPQSDLVSLKWINKKKKDHVDEILVEELREEEPEWVNYDDDELAVKMQLSDSIFESLLTETVMVLSTVHRRKERNDGDVQITAI
ncbi:centrosome-associated protein 350-like [Saccoglossus kowalevskii]